MTFLHTSVLIDSLAGTKRSAIANDAELWTLNVADFKDIPNLRFSTAV